MTNLPEKDYVPIKTHASTNESVQLIHPSYVNFSLLSSTATQDDVEIAMANARGVPCPPENERNSTKTRKGPCLKSTFPAILHEILSDPTLSDVITWLPHGRSWNVLDMTAFSERVLSTYFKQTKFTSFIRQVNGWGFQRVLSGPKYTYYHELFLRGMPHLAQFMRRGQSTVINCTQKSAASDPDFYHISKIYPLPPLVHPAGADGESNQQRVRKDHDRHRAPRSSVPEGSQGYDHQDGWGLQQQHAPIVHPFKLRPQGQPSSALPWRQNDAQYVHGSSNLVQDDHSRLQAPRSLHPESWQEPDHQHVYDRARGLQQHDHSVHYFKKYAGQPTCKQQPSAFLQGQNSAQYQDRQVEMGSDGITPCPATPPLHPVTNQSSSSRQQEDNLGPLSMAGTDSLDRTSFVTAEQASSMLNCLLDSKSFDHS